MTFNLAQLARQAGRRTNVTLAPIEITDTLKRELYAITVLPVRGWEQQVRQRVRPGYAQAISTLTRDDESDDMAEIIRISEALVAAGLVEVEVRVERWLTQAVKWHEERWNAAVRSGTGIDVFPFIDRRQNDARVKAFLRRITNLISDIDATARKDIAETVWRGFTEQTPRRDVAKELTRRLGIQRARANRIAVDQAQKLNGELTAIRMAEAGLSAYKWRHSGKRNYRPEHLARNGKVYKLGQPAGDEPGFKPFCGCIRLPIVDVEELYG